MTGRRDTNDDEDGDSNSNSNNKSDRNGDNDIRIIASMSGGGIHENRTVDFFLLSVVSKERVQPGARNKMKRATMALLKK